MNILFIGDITAKPGRQILQSQLYSLKKELHVDFTIANGENMAHGKGITLQTLKECENTGIDFFTSGNHIYRQNEIIAHMEEGELPLIRPANYPSYYPGDGYKVVDFNGKKILIINLIGQAFMGSDILNPFRTADAILEDPSTQSDITIVDMHGEATGEKIALGWYLDGRVNAVLGTHTHVQTADEHILPKGTAYMTDVGMTGPKNSVLWVKKENVIEASLYPYRFIRHEVEESRPYMINAVLLEIDEHNKTTQIRRIYKEE